MPDLYTTAELRDALLGASATLLVGTPFNATVLDIYLTTDSNLTKSLNSEDPVQLVINLSSANVTAITNGVTAYGWGNHASAGYELQSNKGQPSGYVPLTAESKIDLAYLPNTVIERLVKVADQAARFALTTATVQNGDSVKQMDTEMFYYVSDDTKLDSEDGYDEYNAGIAGAVEYSNVLNKPANLTSLAGLTFASNSFVKMTGAGTFGLDTNVYLTAESDPVFAAWLATNPNISVFTNDSGYLTSESDTLATVTGRGASSATPVILSTSLQSPLLIGGDAVGSKITYKSTTGVGTVAGIAHQFIGGTDGATTAMTILNNGNVGIGNTNPEVPLHISGAAAQFWLVNSSSDPYILVGEGTAGNQYGGMYWNNGANQIRIFTQANFFHLCLDNATGNIGVGLGTPTALLNIKAGTATAGTAPLKLTAGTNLTTPENGAIEYNGTNLFITSGGVRQTIFSGVQQAHIIDADGSLADITTKFNTLLSQLETLGLLATS